MVEEVAEGIGGIPNRPADDVGNPGCDCGEDCIVDPPGAAIFRGNEQNT